MMVSLLRSSMGEHASPRHSQSNSSRPSQVFASCAFISSVIVLFLLTIPMAFLSSKDVDITPITISPAPLASSALSIALRQDTLDLKQSSHILSRQSDLSSPDNENSDESALARRSSWRSKPSKSWSRYRARRSALISSPSPAAREHDRDNRKPSTCSEKSTASEVDEGRSDSDCQRVYDLLIDPPMFSPPDKRTQQGWVVLVVGVITIVTASLMM
ncbi:hypothetical protein V1520DRAFT_334489 [Lipomyces starkeyi]|uniref:Uncharacterized protein n=1 Tax=Lipomyces starkeyi NRRL Y-11557 TaxID=675824 RepID=A0A1E3Q7E0_LIPST|nr:hypothetical protein LIPSTDRAFT_110720 [Lipomyces starkeyi NRRL Y-11557]